MEGKRKLLPLKSGALTIGTMLDACFGGDDAAPRDTLSRRCRSEGLNELTGRRLQELASQCVTKHISERVRAAESQGHTFIKLAWDETGLRFRFPLEEMQKLSLRWISNSRTP